MSNEDARKREQENMRQLAAAFDAFWLASGREREPNEEDRLTFLGAWAVKQLEIDRLKTDITKAFDRGATSRDDEIRGLKDIIVRGDGEIERLRADLARVTAETKREVRRG